MAKKKNVKKKYKKNKKTRTKRSRFADIPTLVCILFILFGVVLGSIFAYNNLYLGKMIEREDAIAVTGTFESYEYLHSAKSGVVTEVRIYFIDRKELYLDAYQVEMDEKLEVLERGDRLDMLLHPNSEYIWELSSEDGVILAFDDTKNRTLYDNIGFGVILVGLGSFLLSMGIIALFVKYREYKKLKSKAISNRKV